MTRSGGSDSAEAPEVVHVVEMGSAPLPWWRYRRQETTLTLTKLEDGALETQLYEDAYGDSMGATIPLPAPVLRSLLEWLK